MPGLATLTVWVYAFFVGSGVVGIVAVMCEGSYPHYTISDALSTPSGFRAIYAGWVVGALLHLARRQYLITSLFALSAPLFPLPNGQPIVSESARDAPATAVLHVAWAACFLHATSVERMLDARLVHGLGTVFVLCYTGGVLLDVASLAIVGCLLEWTLLLHFPTRTILRHVRGSFASRQRRRPHQSAPDDDAGVR